MSKKRREKRESAARRWAETQESGYSTTKFHMPQGLGFFKPKEGTNKFDIVPFIAGNDNPLVKQKHIDAGDLYFERTFWDYYFAWIQDRWIALGMTFGVKDPIQDWVRKHNRSTDQTEQDMCKEFSKPKKRQIFLVWDHENKDAGLALFEYSAHQFGNVLSESIKTDAAERYYWDEFYFPDEGGFTLEVVFKKNPGYGMEATRIDFIERDEPLPKEFGGQEKNGVWTMNHGICLDDGFLIKVPYEKLKAVFLGEEMPEGEDKQEASPKAQTSRKQQREPEPDQDDEPEEKTARTQAKAKDNGKTGSTESSKPSASTKVKSPGKTKPAPKFAKDDVVAWKDDDGDVLRCEIIKVSPDGSSYTLMDDEENIIKAVAADDLKPWDDNATNEKDEEDDEDFATPVASAKSSKGSKTPVEDDDDDWEDELD